MKASWTSLVRGAGVCLICSFRSLSSIVQSGGSFEVVLMVLMRKLEPVGTLLLTTQRMEVVSEALSLQVSAIDSRTLLSSALAC